MDHSLDALRGRLLIQCRSTKVDSILDIADKAHAGIVLTGTSPESTVLRLRDQGFRGPILCDADRYSGKRRVTARRGTHPAWIRRQRDLGLMPLTDSGYLAPRDWPGLRTILKAAARETAPVVAVLPLATKWFSSPPVHVAITREINKYGVPVAFVFEHDKDPFGVQYLLTGFLQVLATASVPVFLLRCDVSAIGALCHGVHTAAVGTSSSLRHLYPATARRSPRPPGVSAFVTRLLSYHRLETCERIFAGTPDIHHFWSCECTVCEGATPARLDAAGQPWLAASRHSLSCLLRLYAEIFRGLRTPDQLVSSWHETVSHALYVHDQVAETAEHWRKPANLRAWYAIAEDPLPHRGEIPRQPADHQPRVTMPRRRDARPRGSGR
ncbi:hypothetical protein NQK81_05195 [Amycolatopsis roodepoortensis]|uniref:hypothetical protein n=1 Tax=Amycolatopsis roodepoortensis TaxID=700274 RepID=UPI00214CD1E1|nr:hypothetical protein [Amycolatopsis roodepoortensis]UUV32854.1 hypothetical protein NQK81_05195 [Amycolatopsis roodepoortensis]